MKNLILVSSLLAILATGCSTIYLHNGTQPRRSLEMGEWHHDGILRLVEFSPPVDLNDRCEGKSWDTIRIEKTFIQGLAGSVSYGIYDPWDVAFSCKQ